MRYFDEGSARIQESNNRLADIQRKVSTGLAVNRASDAPDLITDIQRVETLQSRQETFARNIDHANRRLALQESNLKGAMDLLFRIKELAVQGANDTLSSDERNAVALEISQLQEGLLDLANTRDESGYYIFAGSATREMPFVKNPNYNADSSDQSARRLYDYQGDSSVVQLQVGDNRTVRLTMPGTEIFKAVPDTLNAGENIEFFAAIDRLISGLQEGSGDKMNSGLDAVDGLLNGVVTARSSVGTAMSVLELQETFLDADRVRNAEVLSKLKDLDYAEALTDLRKEEVILQAAQSTFMRIGQLSLFDYIQPR